MKYAGILLLAILLSGCAGKTRLIPQAYMPEPPAILMQPPLELHTIKPKPKPEEAPKDD